MAATTLRRLGVHSGHWGQLSLASAILAKMLWCALEERHEELMPGFALGPPATAAAYAAWPVDSSTLAKLAYLLTHLPALLLHIHVFNWVDPTTFTAPLAVIAIAMSPWMRTARARLAFAAGSFCFIMLVAPVTLLLCVGAAEQAPCEAYQRTGFTSCPSCRQATNTIQVINTVATPAWGIFLLPLMLPAGVWSAVAGLCWWLGPIVLMSTAVRARYGDVQVSGRSHAPVPITWRAFSAAATQQPLHLDALAGALLLPAMLAIAVAALTAQHHRRRAGTTHPAGARPCFKAGGDAACAKGAACVEGSAAVAAAAAGTAACSGSTAAAAAALAAATRSRPLRTASVLAAPAVSALTSSRRYTSASRRAMVIVKVRTPEGDGGRCAAELAQSLPGAILAAVSAAQAAAAGHVSGGTAAPATTGASASTTAASTPPAPAAAAPALAGYVGFPGCYQAVAEVLLSEEVEPADVVAALTRTLRLRGDVQLAGAWVVPVEAHAAGTKPAASYAPACLSSRSGASREVVVTLPVHLEAQLRAQGRGLRVVLSTSASQDTPLLDLTLRAGEAGWPVDGRLHLTVPPSRAGMLLKVILLSAAPPPAPQQPAQHAADTYITALPLLVLPEAACEEVLALWLAMREETRRAVAEDAATEAEADSEAFASSFLPLVRDLGALLTLGRKGGAEPLEEGVLAYLRGQGMHACERLLLPGAEEAGGAGGGAAAHGRVAGRDLADPTAAGGAGGASEAEYERWKAAQLVAGDAWSLATYLLMVALLSGAAASRGGSASLVAFVAAQAAIFALRGLVCVCARGVYLRHRATLVTTTALLHSAYASHMEVLLSPADLTTLMSWMRKPWQLIVFFHTLVPLMQQLTAKQTALAVLPLLYESHVLYTLSTGRPQMPAAAYVALPACAVALAALSDSRTRRRWAAARRAASSDGSAPAACAAADAHGAKGKAGSSAADE